LSRRADPASGSLGGIVNQKLSPNCLGVGQRFPSKIKERIKMPEVIDKKIPQIFKLLVNFWAAASPYFLSMLA
jgi:hypothetical protein